MGSLEWVYLDWTRHPEIVTIVDNEDYVAVLQIFILDHY